MKKLITFMIIFLLTIVAASAQLTVSNVALGDRSQERDENATATLTLTNTGASDITSIIITTNADIKYTVGFSPSSVATLSAGASTTVTVESFVPEDQDAGVAMIGTITATGTFNASTITGTSILSIQAENNLIIKDLEVIVNDDDTDVDDGEDVDVFPLAKVEMVFKIKNTHKDIDIEDVEITVEGEDDLDDIDEDDDLGDIRDGKTEEVSFSFTIDEDAEDGSYDIEIILEGEDENGAMHGETWIIEFDLEEEGIIITSAQLQPDTLRCGDNSVNLRVELTNVGDRDEDDISFEIESTSLNFEKRVNNLEIEEDDEIIRTYTIPVPEDTPSGTYPIDLRAFLDFDEKTHERTVFLAVPSGCSVEEEEDTSVIVVTTPPVQPKDDTIEDLEFVDSGSGQAITGSFLGGSNILSTTLLVLANVLLLVGIVALVMKFLIRRD